MGETLRTLRTLCGGMAGSVVLFALFSWLILRTRGAPLAEAPGGDPLLPWLLVTAGFVCLVAAPFLGRSIFLRVREQGASSPEAAALVAYRASILLAFGLREAGGLLGAITAFVTGEVLAGYLLAAAALAMMVRSWPRREHLKSLMGPAV